MAGGDPVASKSPADTPTGACIGDFLRRNQMCRGLTNRNALEGAKNLTTQSTSSGGSVNAQPCSFVTKRSSGCFSPAGNGSLKRIDTKTATPEAKVIGSSKSRFVRSHIIQGTTGPKKC